MANPIRMPMPGQMTEECTVLQWFKAEGDTVSKGDPLFEIETDKSNMEIEAFDEGTLLRIDALEGATVPVESIVAWIGQPGEELPEPAPAEPAPVSAPAAPSAPATEAAATPAPATAAEPGPVSAPAAPAPAAPAPAATA
ncbi:MAG: lipoyl domain-containing protein, partial [Chloroflexota bacterium]